MPSENLLYICVLSLGF